MYIPTATYRVQLHKDFTLANLRRELPYLSQLGISTIYASPIFRARPGSTHGYDVTDPEVINPEIGTLKEFERLQKDLKKLGMGWIQDIVPNHMAFSPDNVWLMDVLELGPQSRYYRYFDIDWEHPQYQGKVMAPFLGDEPETLVEEGQIQLVWEESGLFVQFYESRYPVSLLTWEVLLELAKQSAATQKAKDELERFLSEILKTDKNSPDFQHNKWLELKQNFGKTFRKNKTLRAAAEAAVTAVNQDREQLRKLLDRQFYQLAFWKKSDEEINYRRFFTVNELICLNIQRPEVFEDHHRFVLELLHKGYIQGLRIDHIDGLHHPQEYLQRLRQEAGPEVYINVEKILELDEKLPEDWPVQGTTGYGFMALLNHLFTRFGVSERFSDIYRKVVPEMPEYHELVFQKKDHMLRHHMQGELSNLLRLMQVLGLQPAQHLSENDMRETLLTWLASFPVYRLYGCGLPLTGTDAEILQQTLAAVEHRKPHLHPAVEHLRSLFTNAPGAPGTEAERLHFLMRCQQFTGPLAAKGVEDTTFYHYNRLISHNEVGDSPHWFGVAPPFFHERMQHRNSHTPHSLNATATHDTKRGEDARIGLNVLTEMPDEWEQYVMQWREMNRQFVQQTEEGRNIPSRNDEYFLYQALLAAYPMSGQLEEDLLPRLKQHMTKAVREAKVRSNWSDPNEAYEQGVHRFIDQIFSPGHRFREAIRPLLQKLSHYGMLYSLGQLLLKCTAPGVPDVYQGCELWELSMVDPDNRRPVDFELRRQYLSSLQKRYSKDPETLLHELKINWTDGCIKMYCLWQALQARNQLPELFSEGSYFPLSATGSRAGNLVAFARQREKQWCVVLVPHELVNVVPPDEWPLGEQVWQDTRLPLPEGAPARWKNVFTGTTLSTGGSIAVAEALQQFPVALLVAEPASD